MPDQPELLEHLQRAVDGRDVDRGRVLADLGQHLVGRRVAELLDGAEDQLALGREPVALLAQPLAPVAVVAVIGYCLASWAWVCGWSSWPIAAMS